MKQILNTSNITSEDDIKNLEIPDMNIPEGYTNEYYFNVVLVNTTRKCITCIITIGARTAISIG